MSTLHTVLVGAAGAAILSEGLVLVASGRRYDVRDASRSVALGVVWIAVRMLGGKVLSLAAALWVWAHVGPVQWDVGNPATWVAYWLIGDFVYYWIHRAEHRVRLLWSSHQVHHSSEQFNLATAVRQPWTEILYKPFLSLWAPLLGFHPTMYVVMGVITLLAGQWQHLAWFPRVRWLDALVMTPSNHRVHHGRNPQYIDRNFGGGLVVWDRLFGTYAREIELPEYGLAHEPPLSSIPRAALGGYPRLVRDARAVAGAGGKARLILGPP